MNASRRDFLRRTSVFAAGFLSLRNFCAHATDVPLVVGPYGPLVDDINGVLELPAGFSYRVISVSGNTMGDGLIIPGLPDGMAAFPGPNGLTVIVRNHELLPFEGPGAFGKSNEFLSKIDKTKLFDAGFETTPHLGGTTTLVYDTNEQKVVSEFLSLAGTSRNCAGGPTPWNSWITCEESVVKAGQGVDGEYRSERDHGYNFEVPATTEMKLHHAVPLTDMGRFYHEAVAIDPQTGIVYETEDRDDGLIYRFIPNEPGKLSAGGQLQVLKFRDAPSLDTRNWEDQAVAVGKQHAMEWLDIDNVESPDDDLRYRGFEAGAAKFARGEGMWYSEGQIFIACTNGGKAQTGQIWRIILANQDSGEPDRLELYIEPNDSKILQAADNMIVAPWGDIIICEDHQDDARIMGITPSGTIYPLAKNHLKTEFAGVAFSPDGTTLFVNLQVRGLTVAITGPWDKRAAS
jgi:secreted PhoX family phosphatase